MAGEQAGEGQLDVTGIETWKASERRMAAILGGVRVPVTGRARGSVPDIEGASVAGRRLAIEHKYGSRIISARVHEALLQARAARRSPADIAIVTIEEAGLGRLNERLVLMDAQDFANVIAWYEGRRER